MPVSERDFKDRLYDQLARVGAAVASPKRLELLDLLAQGERSVESVAEQASMTIANTSQHLQGLRQARLVEARRDGTRVLYRLADDSVGRFFVELRQLAQRRLAEVDQLARDYFEAPQDLEAISRTELRDRLRRKDVVLIDVRPAEEYGAVHIKGALSIPLAELKARLKELPRDQEVVAYCRGPYCVFASEAVRLLRQNGFTARRLEDGFPEWRLAGLPVEYSAK
ncbi:MAG TPA: ArsR family transcriptional regulator [Chloroflexi bacterium]|jgi:rhodanese-related sulfurtransferase|nr:ArsR family transcriptional regulator [Chloroflexota bacterium]